MARWRKPIVLTQTGQPYADIGLCGASECVYPFTEVPEKDFLSCYIVNKVLLLGRN